MRPGGAARLVEPLVELAARAQHQLRPHEPLDVAGARLVAVRVGVGREDPRHLQPRARDVAREIGDLGGRRHDGRVVIAAAAGQQHQQREEGEQAEHRGALTLLKLILVFTSATLCAMARTDWQAHAQRELTRSGHRAGGAREEVLGLLAGQECCLSAQAIHDRLRDEQRAVGLASVYRAVDVLARLGLVRRVDVDGTACYEPADPSGEHHHHAICDRCGRLDAFEDAELEQLIDGLAERLGYAVEAHDVVLRGACPDCAPRPA